MAIDTSIPRTRRALLAGGIGGLAAFVASALGRPLPAGAANGESVILGATNTETKTTRIVNSGGTMAFEAWDATERIGGAISVGGTGVIGESDSDGPGVWGRSQGNGTGVFGWSQAMGVEFGTTIPAKTGVYGRAIQDGGSRGVTGETTAGRGVNGVATTGTAVYAQATTGYALRAVGRVKLDKCAGVATIGATKSSVVVTPGIELVSTSAVVATLQGSAGGAVVERVVVNATANTFTIYLTKAATQNVKVAWHVFG